MTSSTPKKKCFVIMPFGDKKDAEGNEINSDVIYTHLIEKAVESLKELEMECVRCDKIAESGWIHSRMFNGARKKGGQVVEDLVANELASEVGKDANVPPSEVIATGSGELERTHGVKKIFHAASVVGQVGRGYMPIADVAMCVRSALELADNLEFDDLGLKTMLFPLMGTGTGRGELDGKARELIGAAISHLTHNQPCKIDRVSLPP
jgi:O-acetyl-ADP-ribose deacetylase (regulator of RNase III)